LGIDVKSDARPGNRSGIVLLGLGMHAAGVLHEAALRDRVGVTVRENGVRVSPHGYNTAADIDAVLEVLSAS